MKLSLRLWILIALLVLSVLAISPSFEKGVVIKSVEKNSTAFNEGLRPGMIIKFVDNQKIETIQDYSDTVSEIFPIKNNESKKIIIQTTEQEFILFTKEAPEITVSDIPRTNIKKGLELQGGSRALVSPEKSLSSSEMADLISVTNERLNVFGISDVTIKSVRDLTGRNYMLVEVAGASPGELKDLVGKQGKFEAKIGNEVVFEGGEKDISDVCKNAQCMRVESCDLIQTGEYTCRFSFAVYLSEDAAKRHAEITEDLEVNVTTQGRYLNKKLDLYLDDVLVDSLFIGEDLKGRITTQVSVSGSGYGKTQEEAYNDARQSMNKLQTILITGSLPYKLEIAKLDSISPTLGEKFIYYLLLAGFASLIAVSLIVFIRYRKIKSAFAVLFTSFSEVFIILGFASFIKWNLDLASIAGILAVIGTGVDQRIIMLDESHSGRIGGLFEKLKRAFFIIVGAYFTSLAAMIPLYWAGAGLLKGFAFTTIVGITLGVLITRPAFADILKKIES